MARKKNQQYAHRGNKAQVTHGISAGGSPIATLWAQDRTKIFGLGSLNSKAPCLFSVNRQELFYSSDNNTMRSHLMTAIGYLVEDVKATRPDQVNILFDIDKADSNSNIKALKNAVSAVSRWKGLTLEETIYYPPIKPVAGKAVTVKALALVLK